jgi:dynein heavy chain
LAVDTYISHALGRDYLLVQPLDLAQVHDEANAFVPMITILSMGSDPTGKIQELCRKRKKRVEGISMGQGQEPAARKLLEVGITEGIWVLLQNCHLGLSFMGELMEWTKALPKLEDTSPGSVLPTYRLWITAEPNPDFPIGLLQLAIKFTNEAPAGIMLGVRNTYPRGTTRTSSTRSATRSGRRCSSRSPSCTPSCRSGASSARSASTSCTSSRRPTSRRASRTCRTTST